MATRLHKLTAMLDKQKDPAFDEYKRLVKSFVPIAKQFDFGDEDKVATSGSRDALISYSLDMAENGLFKLPYEATCICTTTTHKVGPAKGQRSDDCYLFMQLDDSRIGCLQFGIVPAFEVIAYIYYVDINIKNRKSTCINGLSFRSDDKLRAHYYVTPRPEEVEEARNWIPSLLFAYIGLLNSKSVEIKTVASNGSVNRRRAKEGKPPIGEVYEVHLKLDGQRYSIDGNPIGSGSSKRAHWRRGHIRHLPSGEITNVRPCLVAFTGNENVPEQIYKVTA